jgi:hypothetical protein
MGDPLITLPHGLLVNKLPNGEKEFFCHLCFPMDLEGGMYAPQAGEITAS